MKWVRWRAEQTAITKHENAIITALQDGLEINENPEVEQFNDIRVSY